MEQAASGSGRGTVAALITGPRRELLHDAGNQRLCVIVLGMHRSGTSALAGTLGILGVTLPNDPIGELPSNPKGHFESAALNTIHERMLSALHSTWYDPRPISSAAQNSDIALRYRDELAEAFKNKYERASLFVFKDPRTCRFFPLSRAVIESLGVSPRVIVCFRNPIEVAKSLKRRDGISLSHGFGLWLRHVLDAEYTSRGLPRVFSDYSEFLQDWRSTISQIERRLSIKLPGRWTDAEDAVDEFLEAGLRHETSSTDEMKGRFGDQSWVTQCYSALCELVRDPDNHQVLERLDTIRSGFEEASGLFGAGIKQYYGEIQDEKKSNALQADRLDQEISLRTAAEQQSELLNRALSDTTAQLESVRTVQASTLSSLHEVQVQHSTLQQRQTDLAQLLEARDSELERLRAEQATNLSSLQDIEARRSTLEQQHAEMSRTLEARDAAHATSLNQLNAEIDRLRSEHGATLSSLQDVESRRSTLEQQHDELGRTLEASEVVYAASLNDLNAQLVSARAEHAATLSWLHEIEARRSTLEEQHAKLGQTLEATKAAHTNTLQELNSRLESACLAHAGTLRALEQREKDLAQAQQEKRQIEKGLIEARSALEAEQARLDAELEALRREYETGRTEREQLTQQLEDARKAASEQQTAIVVTENCLQEMRQRHLKLQETFSEQVVQVDGLRNTLMSQLQELVNKDSALEEARSQLQATEGRLDNTVARLELAQNNLLSTRDELQAVTSELERVTVEALEFETAMRDVIDERGRKLADTAALLEAAMSENATRDRELRDAANELEAAASEIASRDRALGDAANELGAATSEIAKRDRELVIAAEELNAVRSEFAIATSTLDQIYRSRSWRLTAPLRRLSGLLPRRGVSRET